jgi:hypothetical protein
MRRPKTEYARLLVFGQAIAGLLASDHGRENDDALFTFADETSHLEPSVESGDVRWRLR